MNISQLVYPFCVHGHVGSFSFGIVMKDAATNILAQYKCFVDIHTHFPQVYPQVQNCWVLGLVPA